MRTTKNISITIPPSLLKQATAIAKKEGRTQSELVREAIRRYIRAQEWQEIRALGTATARRLGITPQDIPRLIKKFRQA